MKSLKGKYIYKSGKLLPNEEMQAIEEKLKSMQLCADSGPCDYGSFYFDPSTNSYWQCIQNEQYDTELKPVSREEASKKYPSVDFSRLLDK